MENLIRLVSVLGQTSFHLTLRILRGEQAPSNKTPAFTESMNMDIWVVGTLKNKVVAGKTRYL